LCNLELLAVSVKDVGRVEACGSRAMIMWPCCVNEDADFEANLITDLASRSQIVQAGKVDFDTNCAEPISHV
jgi:hypothetical protein